MVPVQTHWLVNIPLVSLGKSIEEGQSEEKTLWSTQQSVNEWDMF